MMRPFQTFSTHLANKKNSGVALITALLIVSLATVATVSLTASHQLDLRRSLTTYNFGQAQMYGRSIEALANELVTTIRNDADLADKLTQTCQTPPLQLEMGGFQIQARLKDLHCRINLNNLLDSEDEATESGFIRLVDALNRRHADMELDAQAIISALRDWQNPEVENDWYTRQSPPYRSANQPLSTTSELLLIRGMNPTAYRYLEPYVTALPESGTALNEASLPPLLRDAFEFPPQEEMDTEKEGAWGRYIELAISIRQESFLYSQCAVFDAEQGTVLYRYQQPCPPAPTSDLATTP